MNTNRSGINTPYYQHTLKDSFTCISQGLHTGLIISMRVTPGEPNTGIVFVRRDVDSQRSEIQASWKNVIDTRLSTTIANSSGIRVSTVEHLMAALYAKGIDNARVLIDGPEVPIMDGSAAPFVKLIKQTGIVQQSAERHAIVVKHAVTISRGGKFAAILPSFVPWIQLKIDFDSLSIGQQKFSALMHDTVFENELAPARTFGFKDQVSTLRKLGLAQGGTIKNVVLVDGDEVVNEEGLRYKDEFVRHKMVDSIGDIALIGARIIGQYSGICSGHHLNHELIKLFMANEQAWQYTTTREAHRYWGEIVRFPYIAPELDHEIRKKFEH